jgi:hypothetical protein
MNSKKRVASRNSKDGKFSYQPLTVGDVEKQSGAKFKVSSNTKATTYLTNSGVPSLGRVLQKVERKLAHNN